MKFMNLGSKPDIFYTTEAIRSVSSEVSCDLIVQVKGCRYLLHKFPLLSKCLRLQKLCCESPETSQPQIIQLNDFPVGIEEFELCAKFCYGIKITISAHNIVAAKTAAEYLNMTEHAEKGNLIYKLEVFFSSCILHGWKDSFLTLQTTKSLPLWSEKFGIVSRCIEAIASKVQAHPKKWWAEDMADLEMDLYWRVMVVIKSSGKIPSSQIGYALKLYASKWLPNISKDGSIIIGHQTEESEICSKYRFILESIVSLLPSEKGSSSCGFLLKLLKAANVLNALSSLKMELVKRVCLQLEEATVSDLLIPSTTASKTNGMKYDVDMVMNILEQYFMLQRQSPPTSPQKRSNIVFEKRRRSRSAENIEFVFQESRRCSSASHSSKLKVAKLVDGYLGKIGRDVNLPMGKFVSFAEMVPGFSRLNHDDLYKAIDVYLKAHPRLNKKERKRVCEILDCKKLSPKACMDAAQNELLPLTLVLQVLFFEQARAAMSGAKVTEIPSNIKALMSSHGIDPSRPLVPPPISMTDSIEGDQYSSVSGLKSPKPKVSLTLLPMKLTEVDHELDEHRKHADGNGGKMKSVRTTHAPHKRMFSKLLSIN